MKNFIKYLKQKSNKLKLRQKTMLAFLLVSMIPLAILGGFSFIQTRSFLIKQEENNLKATLNQTALTLNNQLENYNKILITLSFNQEIINASNMHYTTSYDMFNELNNVFDSNFIIAENLVTGVTGITLYTGTNLPQHGKSVIPIKQLSSKKWYKDISQTVATKWYYTDGELFCARRILNTQVTNPKNNILVVKVDYTRVFNSLKAFKRQGINVVVADASNRVIYTSSSKIVPVFSHLVDKREDYFTFDNQRFTILNSKLPVANWKIYLYESQKHIAQSAQLISITVLILIGICYIIVFMASKLFSKKMVLRIERLHENIKIIENGSLEVTVTSNSKDEIGDLIQGFGKMVNRIKHLIDEVYIAKIQQKEYEIKALQAQINPHFLYNSLSLINWRALRIHADDISEMAQLLSNFYRTTLNKGNSAIAIMDELLNVKSYVSIQLIMHSNNFDVEYSIDDNVKLYKMPNLMLQPLVENAILHGIDYKENGRGKIILSCKICNDEIIFHVEDNGIGIAKEHIPYLLKNKSKGYGVKNVNDRAKLLYGDIYGLTIESTRNVGTTVILKLPLDS